MVSVNDLHVSSFCPVICLCSLALFSGALFFSSSFPTIVIFYLILKAYSTLDFSVHLFKVHFTMKLTYRTLPNDEDDEGVQQNDADITEAGGSPRSETHNRTQWDDDCPWSEWYSAEDPIKGDVVRQNSLSLWLCV